MLLFAIELVIPIKLHYLYVSYGDH